MRADGLVNVQRERRLAIHQIHIASSERHGRSIVVSLRRHRRMFSMFPTWAGEKHHCVVSCECCLQDWWCCAPCHHGKIKFLGIQWYIALFLTFEHIWKWPDLVRWRRREWWWKNGLDVENGAGLISKSGVAAVELEQTELGGESAAV